ncbi:MULTISPECIES: NAD(P)H-dependent oxidoreductase [unclassified Beijerinckia]|uniref:NADPH-dependent FMN reductase n=1 Tax=unclassified Beijerinckia TaxID=2638183 RepID=UPI0008965CDD|nr:MULTISPECIES: NAD(P)H-dependent oxidoreductase [unclassified Beijerinckia]MDH7799546.1 NAD(P)H-dependent FMN reductase [Beijerinckia sp. GAS462]SEB46406.1 NAD(P)H-dependent FMN reductase [Beijerinckia sp. 28-YEA-48]
MPSKLHVIITSTRPGRIGPAVGKWFNSYAQKHGGFDSTLVDLADFNLPVFDEPMHPRMQKYEHAHTKKWSESVKSADAYVFVVPEYNYNPPPSFFNALNYVYNEWNYKVAGFVSYGGVSGGLRSAQVARSMATSLKLVTPPEGVPVPAVGALLDDKKEFKGNDAIELSAKTLLDEMLKWDSALKTLR